MITLHCHIDKLNKQMGSCYAPESNNSNKHVISVHKLKIENNQLQNPIAIQEIKPTIKREKDKDSDKESAAPVSESERKASKPILNRLIHNQKK